MTAYLISFVALVAAAYLVFRVLVGRDYLRKGRLTLMSASLESLVWGLFFAFPVIYIPPPGPAFWLPEPESRLLCRYAGSVLIVVGWLAVILTMGFLGFRRAFGRQVDALRTTGPYAVTRNPQIVAGSLIVLGVVVRWPSWYAGGWLILFAAMAHLMVRTEEEHLHAVFGDAYREYCRRVPRYLGMRRQGSIAR